MWDSEYTVRDRARHKFRSEFPELASAMQDAAPMPKLFRGFRGPSYDATRNGGVDIDRKRKRDGKRLRRGELPVTLVDIPNAKLPAKYTVYILRSPATRSVDTEEPYGTRPEKSGRRAKEQ